MKTSRTMLAAGTVLLIAACGVEDQDQASQPVAQASVPEVEDPIDADEVVPSTTTIVAPSTSLFDNAPYDPLTPQPPEPPIEQQDLAELLTNDIETSSAVGAYCFSLREVTRWRAGSQLLENAEAAGDESDELRQTLEEMARAAEQAEIPASLSDAANRSIERLDSAEPPAQGADFYAEFVEQMKELSVEANSVAADAPTEEAYQLYVERFSDLENWPDADAFAIALEENSDLCEP